MNTDQPARARVRRLGLGVAALLAAAAAGCSSAPASTPPTVRVQNAAAGSAAEASGPFMHLRDMDKKGPGAANTVTLRTCPQTADNLELGENAWGLLCHTQENLPDGTHVTMQCWVSTYPPDNNPADTSAKWFKVTVAEGSFAGEEGWVWSDLVASQTPHTPQCTSIGHEHDPSPSPQPQIPLRLVITGSCTTAGGTLTGVSSGFTPGATYELSATRPDGTLYPLPQKEYPVHADGSITWTWPCQGDPAGTYTTTAVDLGTGRTVDATFTIGAPNQPPPPNPTTPAAPGTTAPPPPGTTPPQPQPPTTYYETTGGVTHTWTNPANAGGTQGPSIPSNNTVQIACKLTGFKVADGNTWWYRIAASPWNSQYYASADAFYNNGQTSGSLHGTPWVDNAVPTC